MELVLRTLTALGNLGGANTRSVRLALRGGRRHATITGERLGESREDSRSEKRGGGSALRIKRRFSKKKLDCCRYPVYDDESNHPIKSFSYLEAHEEW